MTEAIGYIAGALISTSLFPQMIKTIRTKDTAGISLAMYSIYNVGVVLLIIYGFLIEAIPIVITNIIAFVPASIILYLKIKNNDNDKIKK